VSGHPGAGGRGRLEQGAGQMTVLGASEEATQAIDGAFLQRRNRRKYPELLLTFPADRK